MESWWVQVGVGVASASIITIAGVMVKLWTNQKLIIERQKQLSRRIAQQEKARAESTLLLTNQINLSSNSASGTIAKMSDQVNEHAEHQAVFQQKFLQVDDEQKKQGDEINRIRDNYHSLRTFVMQELADVVRTTDDERKGK